MLTFLKTGCFLEWLKTKKQKQIKKTATTLSIFEKSAS